MAKALNPSPELHLTPRQREILRLYVQGLEGKAIAERLGISRDTVYKHVQYMTQRHGLPREQLMIALVREEHRD